ncbi:MAG: RpiR family transcriptional regulator [Rhodobacterales bacterium]|nr:MAG: RpiR family transcriptional regulator [Rhodobacterales bacterium]
MKDMAAPGTVEALQALLRNPPVALSRRLTECAAHILENGNRIAVSTLNELVEGSSIQPSTVVRLCQALGLSGFSELQRLYRSEYAGPATRYNLHLQGPGPRGKTSRASLWGQFLDANRQSVEGLIDTVPIDTLTAAAKMLARAETVHVVGCRGAFAVACHLAYTLDRLNLPVIQHLLPPNASLTGTMRPNDVVLAITFAPHAPQTIDVTSIAKQRGLPVVAITDMLGQGLAGLADLSLNVREQTVNDLRGLSASMTLGTALAVFAGQLRERAEARATRAKG